MSNTTIKPPSVASCFEFRPLNDGHGSWIMHQLESGRPLPAIRVELTPEDTIRFAHRTNRIAAAVEDYRITRSFHRHNDGKSYALFYSVKGSFEHATISEIKLIQELLLAKFEDDYQLILCEFEPILQRQLETRISFRKSAIYLYLELSFKKEFQPSADYFKEV